MEMKKCSKCGRMFPATEEYFYKRKDSKDGLRNDCKECRIKTSKKNYEGNKEHIARWGKQYREANKEYIAEYKKQYREANKERIAEHKKQYYEANKERILEHCKQYREANKEYYKEYGKQYREANKEYIVEYGKQYYKDNKDKVLERHKEYHQQNKDKISAQRKEYYEQNKDKISAQKKEWYEQNKDKISEWGKQYREQNKDKILEYHKEYYEQNKDKLREQHKEYYQSPRGQVSHFNSRTKRRAKEETQGNGITPYQWLEMMSFFDWKCAYSGEYLGGKDNQSIRSLDHIVPLNKGGENEIWNVVPMTRSLNSSKQDKDMLEWYQQQDFYSEERLAKIREWQEYAYQKYYLGEVGEYETEQV